MKILLSTSSVTPNAGIPSFNRELCSLLGQEHEMHLLVDENISAYTGYTKVYSTYGLKYSRYSDSQNLVNELNSEKYDIIFNSNSHTMSVLAPYMTNASRIITVSHSLGSMDCDNAVFNKNFIDDIIVLSDSCKKYLEKRFHIRDNKKITVIYNSVADKDNAEVLREKKKNEKKIKIVFAGGTASSKSPDLVIPIIWELCKTDLSFEFYWLGITTPPLKRFQSYNDVRKILPNDERVIVTGRIPQHQAAEIIADCNVFLSPSRREGFPMALLEAMRVGCIPIVADYEIANKEIINHAVNGFVLPHEDVDMFVALLKDIILNHTKYYSIYDECYKTFTQSLSFPIWYSKINALIGKNNLCHQKRISLSLVNLKINVLKFFLLDNYNLIENHLFEVLPCAIKFYRYNNQLNNK